MEWNTEGLSYIYKMYQFLSSEADLVAPAGLRLLAGDLQQEGECKICQWLRHRRQGLLAARRRTCMIISYEIFNAPFPWYWKNGDHQLVHRVCAWWDTVRVLVYGVDVVFICIIIVVVQVVVHIRNLTTTPILWRKWRRANILGRVTKWLMINQAEYQPWPDWKPATRRSWS